MRVPILVGVLAALLSISAPAQNVLIAQGRNRDFSKSLAPYVVSPQHVVDLMLDLADLRPGETLYDLGSGDGRVLITAAQHYRAKAVGIEIEEGLARTSEQRIASMGLQNMIRVIHADMRTVDLSPADVVTMYLMTESNESLKPQLEHCLRAGVRVVSHDYKVPGWKANREEKAETYARGHMIYLYIMPPRK
ncbi:MAG: class I SAM-dependent methyltransferase [Bryobacteraceae bacterium]|jgi:protein-L-isoaspartate O-methyltransferase